MIISIVSVGESYNEKLKFALDFFKSYDVCLLSDKKRDDVFYFEKYEGGKFSYFDKLYFSLDLVTKFKRDVFYVDVTKISEVNLDFSKDCLFYYKSHWPFGDLFQDYLKYDFFDPLVEDWDDLNVDYKKLPAIRETELFFSKDLNADLVIEKLKSIQYIFRKMSIKKPTYPGYDNAEGIALAYALRSIGVI